MRAAIAFAHFFAGRYEDALSWAEIAIREQPNVIPGISIAAASAAFAGRQLDAERAMARLLERQPELRLSNLERLFPIRRAEDYQRWSDGLRRAGLPE